MVDWEFLVVLGVVIGGDMVVIGGDMETRVYD